MNSAHRLLAVLLPILALACGCAGEGIFAPAPVYPPAAYPAVGAAAPAALTPPVAPAVYPAAPGSPPPVAAPGVVAQPGVAATPGSVLPPGGTVGAAFANPIHVQVADVDAFWTVLTDVIDDYFHISHEERVRQVGEVLTEGRIDTYPLTGATIFEPWRGDSVGTDQRWESTLQSIRRRALVRVIPEAGGFQVEVQVLKELENLERPEQATAAAGAIGLNETFERPRKRLGDDPATIGWIPKGRDPALEQKIIAELMSRVAPLRPVPY